MTNKQTFNNIVAENDQDSFLTILLNEIIPWIFSKKGVTMADWHELLSKTILELNSCFERGKIDKTKNPHSWIITRINYIISRYYTRTYGPVASKKSNKNIRLETGFDQKVLTFMIDNKGV